MPSHSNPEDARGHDRMVWVQRYARWALAAAFLSAVAARFGLWHDGGTFASFIAYTRQVNSFLPASLAPLLAWAATGAELGLGLALLVGVGGRRVACAAALLLAFFGSAMALSYGVKEPLDYSVFSASAAALLLAERGPKAAGGRP